MPGCTFSVSGLYFDVDAFWATSPWQEYTDVYHRGDMPRIQLPNRPKLLERSGFSFGISDYDEDCLQVQTQDAIEFLTEERTELERLAAFPGVDQKVLDIGLFWWADTICQSHVLPPELLRLAGEFGVSVVLSIYGVDRNRPPD